MTIAVSVQVHDGVVLASDSASTLIATLAPGQPSQIVNVYDNANKIFNLRKGLAIGGMTYGAGSMGASSISTLCKDLRARFSGLDLAHEDWMLDPATYTIEGVALKAREFFYEEHWKSQVSASDGGPFGFFVAGYSACSPLSETWLIEILNNSCEPPRCLRRPGESGTNAGGDPEAFCRLVLGHGQQLAPILMAGGVDPDKASALVADLEAKMHVELVEAPMPIQDAIEFAEFLVHTTIGFTRFKRGAPTVGGPIESAAITKHEGFKWVRRKHYFDAVLNPGEAHGNGKS